MGSILIAMPKVEESNRIAGLLREFFPHYSIDTCSNAAEVLRLCHARDNGVIIGTKRVCEMGYREIYDYLPDNFKLLILTKDRYLEIYEDKMLKLLMPFKRSELISTIEMITDQYQYRSKKKKKNVPKRSKEEQKIIDNAKAMLMENHGMTEPEAFRYIQKNSMDYSRTMVESAQMLLMIHDRS